MPHSKHYSLDLVLLYNNRVIISAKDPGWIAQEWINQRYSVISVTYTIDLDTCNLWFFGVLLSSTNNNSSALWPFYIARSVLWKWCWCLWSRLRALVVVLQSSSVLEYNLFGIRVCRCALHIYQYILYTSIPHIYNYTRCPRWAV